MRAMEKPFLVFRVELAFETTILDKTVETFCIIRAKLSLRNLFW